MLCLFALTCLGGNQLIKSLCYDSSFCFFGSFCFLIFFIVFNYNGVEMLVISVLPDPTYPRPERGVGETNIMGKENG
jgi:hypothetical protein